LLQDKSLPLLNLEISETLELNETFCHERKFQCSARFCPTIIEFPRALQQRCVP
jgi:hypothetical protein